MSESPLESKPIICEEVFDEHSVPSEEEVIEYAKKIGINPKCEPHLLPIAFQGLMQPLPKGWKPCLDASINRWYYYNKVTKVSQWEHPLDSVYRDLVKRGRSEGYSSAAEDDSKGTAREGDLKSLEEVSDLVPSSKSNEPPPPPSLKNNNNVVSSPSASIETDMKPHEPLLLRRKQMQSGLSEQQDGQLSSLQIAKMMNNAMKEKTALVFETEESTYSIPPSRTSSSVPVTPKQLQPIRRAKTLDPIPNYGQSKGPPIKGILRESSFSGLPNKIVQGTHPDKGQDEEEKKRSVRFADSERKLLDIRFSDSEEDSLSENDDSLSESESDGSDDQDSEKESQNKAKVFNRLNLNAEGIKLINKKLEAINVSQIKDKLLNSPSNVKPLESSSSDESDDCNDPVAVTPPRFNKPKSPQSPLHSEGQKTGRFTVSKSPVDRLPSTPLLFDVKSQPSVTDVTQTSDKGDSEKGEVVTVICQERPLLLDKNLSREPSEEDLKTSEMEDIARKKTSERLAALEERLSREIVEKVAKMKEEQAQRLDIIRDELAEKETIEKANIIKEHNEKLAQIKLSLQQELADKENDLKQKHQQELDALLKKLENDRDAQKMAALARHESLVASAKQEETDRFNAEKARLEAESNVELMKRQEMLNAEIQTLKDEEETKLMKIKSDGISQVDDLKKRYEALIKEEENKYLDELNKIQTEHTVKLSDVKIDKEADLRRVQTEWEDKIKAAELQHRSTLDSTVTNHETSMASLRLQLVKQEETLKREHAERIEAWNSRLKRLTDREPGGVQSANRDYEKMRCEKRLIEDKYRSLKDKYIQLKTDMKIAVERKIQSRARRRKEEISRIEKEVDKKDKNKSDRNANTVSEMSDKAKPFNTTPRINVVGHFQLKDCHDNDVLSDDQFTSLTTSTLPNDDQKSSSSGDRRLAAPPRKRLGRSRFGVESVRDGGDGAHQGNVLDDVKSQLQELEQIEEQIPAQSQGETYLRYPFEGSGLSTSAEVDFYRHRVIVEQEAVRAARECLLQQKRELEARQSILRTNNNTSTMQQLQQQERDLTEMEVSLHRTRALLGEKMIRLRLLGQTLNRLVDDSPSPTSHSAKNDPALSPSVVGFPAETVPFNVLQNLENINSEIREIWSQLGKQQTDGTTPEEPSMATYTKPIPTRSSSSMKPLRRLPSNRADIEARIQGLREWLQKPPSGNIDWSQLTL